MTRALFPRIDRLGTCSGCRREAVPLYRSKGAAKLICRVCLAQLGEVA
jgi:hypothetical protein